MKAQTFQIQVENGGGRTSETIDVKAYPAGDHLFIHRGYKFTDIDGEHHFKKGKPWCISHVHTGYRVFSCGDADLNDIRPVAKKLSDDNAEIWHDADLHEKKEQLKALRESVTKARHQILGHQILEGGK